MKKIRIYLDNCSFNRPFDDQTQLRIKLESEAKLKIQSSIIEGQFDLIWSYILDFENEQNPFEERKISIKKWKNHATTNILESDEILDTAKKLIKKGIKSKDVLHIACAISEKCEYFITTDAKIIKKMEHDEQINVINPLTFLLISED